MQKTCEESTKKDTDRLWSAIIVLLALCTPVLLVFELYTGFTSRDGKTVQTCNTPCKVVCENNECTITQP